MFKYKNDIYDLCSGTFQKAFEAFCDEINKSSADVFVVMAHKAVRLFQILIEQKHISDRVAEKIIVSSHALDFDCSYLVGKKIAIVDDILISGTTIASVTNQLLADGINEKDISIITLAINEKYLGMNFDGEDGKSMLHCVTSLKDAACIELSYTISKIFSYYGISYDVDYPTYDAITIDEKKTNCFFNKFLWETYDITNMQQQEGGVNTYVLFPNENTVNRLWKQIGLNLTENVNLQIRLYLKNYPSERKECYVVPMCSFDEISEQNIDVIFNILKPNKNAEKLCYSYVAKMRFLEFYIAHQLYLLFLKVTSLKNNTIPTRESIMYLFGKNGDCFISQVFNHNFSERKALTYIGVSKNIDMVTIKEYFKEKDKYGKLTKIETFENLEVEETVLTLNKKILMPFLWWYDTKEIPVRLDLAANSRHFIKDFPEIEKTLKRLKSGFSLQMLKTILNNEIRDYKTNHLLSLFIDRAIDNGFIVPTLGHNVINKSLCKMYRHGEDLPFSLQDECRLLYFLTYLSKKIPNITLIENNENFLEGIATISLEKIIILYYQMGLEQGNIFNRFLGFDNINLLKPFLSLHGAIEGVVDPQQIIKQKIEEHFYSEPLENGEEYITWLTKWLDEKCFIEKRTYRINDKIDKKVYVINEEVINEYLEINSRNCISSLIKDNISNIADMLSLWYNSMSKKEGKDAFKEYAVALTSCSNEFVYVSAVATEIHYFSKFWDKQAQKAFNFSNNATSLMNILVEKDEDKKQTLKTEQALHSGRRKVELYNNKIAIEAISKVSDILQGSYASAWSKIWDSVKSGSFDCSKELKEYKEQVIGFLYFFSACYDCLRNYSFWYSNKKPNRYEEYKKLYNEQCNKTGLLKKEMFNKLDRIIQENDFRTKKESLNNLVKTTITDSRDMIKNIEVELENQSKNYTIRYRSSLILEIRALNNKHNNEIIMDVWDQLEENIDKTQINIVELDGSTNDTHFVRYGIFFGNCSIKKEYDHLYGGQILIDIFQKLCEAFDGKTYEIKAILLPDTPPGRTFKHNVKKNIPKYVELFTKDIVDVLNKCYRIDTKQQLVVAMTDYVNKDFYKTLETMKWDFCHDCKTKYEDDMFSEIRIYCNDYIQPIETNEKDVAYSVVEITCGDMIGTGFLFKSKEKVICVSCNHLFTQYSESAPQAISNYSKEFHFLLKPLKNIVINDYRTKTLPASQEVAILTPLFKGRIPFDLEFILTEDDISDTVSQYINLQCRCCGYPKGEQCWSDIVKIVGTTSGEYYQTDIATDENHPIEEGYSGGLIVPNDTLKPVLGIHEGRTENETGRMIPGRIILSEIKKESIICQEQMK